MGTAKLTRSDIETRDAVMRQLEWDPRVDASAVGVAAQDGTVTLSGYIDTYAGKLAAERAAKRVHGVRAISNDVEVRLRLARTDDQIAKDAAHALQLRSAVPDTVQAVVHHGHVTLTGTVNWLFEKHAAENAVRHIRGIRGVLNHIEVAPRVAERDVRRRIVRALHSNADINARHIDVTVSGGRATLTGSVASWLQREAVERAAADAPGVTDVDNRLMVETTPKREQAPQTEPVDELC
jgi:osmotically-inducible protein OsmY